MTTSVKTYQIRMLGVVTLYNPESNEVVENIKRYLTNLDALIVWDNSPLEKNLKDMILPVLSDEAEKIIWHGDGQNYCIAPAINFAWRYALENRYDLLLIMDQDSQWADFFAYRRDIEIRLKRGEMNVFTPYVRGCDEFEITSNEQDKHLMINSGMVMPIKILSEIGGADEKAFPLDALDHDITYTVREHGYRTVCLTEHVLDHSLGQLQRMGIFNMLTPNYNSYRTYSMTRSHIICYRKHKKNLKKEDKQYLYREILLLKFLRIIFAEPDKASRMRAFVRGLISGLIYKIK